MTSGTRRRPYASTDEAVAERRAQILEHTAQIVSSAGVDKCTFAAVSEAAGVSIGSIQHHFRTRDKLIDATVDHRITAAAEEWSEIRSRPTRPLEKLRDLIAFTVEGDRSFADAWGFWIELYAAARKDPSIATKLNEALETWRTIFVDVLGDAQASGLVTSAYRPEDLTRLLLGLVDGLAIQTVNHTYGSTPEEMRALLYRFAARELGIEADQLMKGGPVAPTGR